MKKVLAVTAVLTVLTLGAVAFAHGPGWGYGHMMGPGYGPMMGPGYGYGPGACGGPAACFGTDEESQKFFEETADLRKELHEKRFEYMETLRTPGADRKKLAGLEKEIRELQEKIWEKAPRGVYGMGYGMGRGFRGGAGYGCNW